MPQSLPDNIRSLEKEELEMAVLRVAIMAEFDCINTYEQILTLIKEGELRCELMRILDEDKAHAQRLQEMLFGMDKPPVAATDESAEENEYVYG
jgi:rubrerythrin